MPKALPEKTCAACGRDFAWRRKWKRTWDRVKYCSARCRGAHRGEAARIRTDLLQRVGAARGTICPSEVARGLWPDAWRERMNDVRAEARKLAAEGRLVWTQRGVRVDAQVARGAVRLGRGPGFPAR